MTNITTDAHREIITDFTKKIQSRITKTAKPSKIVIDFRNERKNKYERDIVSVPTELLRFRKENGRIASDVMSYEKNNKPLIESEKEDQQILREFLEKKDPEKTLELCQSLKNYQQEPAIITCDGFLINGNRRKLALDMLYKRTKDQKYLWMNVVILPGSDDSETGGPPTIKEIEQIENRYQTQRTGKAEYYSFDVALSTRRKIEHGMTLEEQLRDDPMYADMAEGKFKKELKKYEEEYLKPLECVDDYLDFLGRGGLYTNVSAGISDREGRWEAFKDYYRNIKKNLMDDNRRARINVDDDEIGDIQSIAFKLIRKREFPNIKLHQMMRDFPKWLSNDNAKKELLEIVDIEDDIPFKEKCDKDGNELDYKDIDRIWSERNKTDLIRQVKKAMDLHQKAKMQETPLELLEAALKKLQHNNLLPQHIKVQDADDAVKVLSKIQTTTKELIKTFLEIKKGPKKLQDKFNRK